MNTLPFYLALLGTRFRARFRATGKRRHMEIRLTACGKPSYGLFPHWYRSGNHLSAFGRAINNLKAKTKKKSLKPKLEALWCGWRDLNQYCAVLCQNAVLIILHSYDFYKRFYSVTRAVQGAVKCKSAVKSAVLTTQKKNCIIILGLFLCPFWRGANGPARCRPLFSVGASRHFFYWHIRYNPVLLGWRRLQHAMS